MFNLKITKKDINFWNLIENKLSLLTEQPSYRTINFVALLIFQDFFLLKIPCARTVFFYFKFKNGENEISKKMTYLVPMFEVVVDIIFCLFFGMDAVVKARKSSNLRRFLRFVKNHPRVCEADLVVFSVVQRIKRDIPPCSECQGIFFQLWNHKEDIFYYRCSGCQKDYNLNEKTSQSNVHDLKVNMIALHLLLAKIAEHKNEVAWKKISQALKYQYCNFEEESFLRAITFESRDALPLKKVTT